MKKDDARTLLDGIGGLLGQILDIRDQSIEAREDFSPKACIVEGLPPSHPDSNTK